MIVKRGGFYIVLAGCLVVLTMRPLFAAPDVRHVVVQKETGRFAGWPANNGIWGWDKEVVVGFVEGTFQKKLFGHAINDCKPAVPRFARSLDGGETWLLEVPAFADAEGIEPEPLDCTQPIDFSHPDFAITLRMVSGQDGFSRFYYSYDRCKSWAGPFRLPDYGREFIAARTDYLVQGPHELTAFITGAKDNGKEGRPFVIKTTDGGLTWDFISWITPEPSGFKIMPATISLGGNSMLTAIRCKDDMALLRCQEYNSGWLEIYRSDDGGYSWNYLNEAASDMGGNPAAMLRLKSGAIALIYGYRETPYGIRARISHDQGLTWGEEIVLRDDGGCWDLGYPRAVEREDGVVVIAYYFNDARFEERYIAATLWKPGDLD